MRNNCALNTLTGHVIGTGVNHVDFYGSDATNDYPCEPGMCAEREENLKRFLNILESYQAQLDKGVGELLKCLEQAEA